jgi:NADP-dependent 3-hydroxy acid dehydrogenase YdfG
VLLTGASAGIGAELAAQLAEAGARQVLAARRADKLGEVAARVRALKGEAFEVLADVANPADCKRLIEESIAKLGGLDLLLLNAGISMNEQFADVKDLSIFDKLMATNYFGPVHLTHHALPALLASHGKIAVVSSLAGKNSLPTRTGYCASKHAVHGFFDSLRAEMLPRGVSVTLICPGAVETEIRHVSKAEGRGSAAPEDVGSGQMMTAAECARQSLDAIKKDKRELLMTLPGKLSPWVRMIAPGFIDRVLLKRMGLV